MSGQIRSVDGQSTEGIRVAAMLVDENGVANPAAATLTSLARTDSQGRYRLEDIPPGRYLVTAGFLDSPSYYPGVRTPAEARSINVVAGSATTGIDFTLASPSGVRVSGRISNLPASAPPGLFRATLVAVGRPETLDVEISGDGTFEFSKVQPGTHTFRLIPSTPQGTQALRLEVGEADLVGIEILASPKVFGRVTVEDGSPLPLQLEAVAVGNPEPPALPVVQATNLRDVLGTITATTAMPRRDGLFALSFPASGEYAITPTLLPTGYYIKSVTHGTVDLLRSPLTVTAQSSPMEVRVVLTSTRPEGTPASVKVSGRLSGLEKVPSGSRVLVSMQQQSAQNQTPSVLRVAQTWARDDGTFEIPEVPPGRYVLRNVPFLSQVTSIDVASTDIADIVVMLRDPGPLSAPTPATQLLPSPINVAPPSTLPVPQAGSGMMSIAQNGRYPREWREGALNYFQIQRAGTLLQEKQLQGPLTFTLLPGSYELRAYSRACEGSCGRLDPPDIQCTVPFTITAGQVLYAERIIQQDSTCTISFKP